MHVRYMPLRSNSIDCLEVSRSLSIQGLCHHGPLALQCLDHLTGESVELKKLAETAGLAALTAREKLWDKVFNLIDSHH